MGRKKLDLDEQAQCIVYAAVHGDELALARYDVSRRSLQRYRELAREEGSDLSRLVALYSAALSPEERPETFAAELDSHTRKLLAVFLDKSQGVNAANPEGMRAVGEMIGRLLDQRTAVDYIDKMFAGEQADGGES